MSEKTAIQARLDEQLDLASKAAKGELGATDVNKSVTAKSTLSVAVTEGGKTKTQAVNAGVTLGVSTTDEPAQPAASCGCCPHECEVPACRPAPAGDSK